MWNTQNNFASRAFTTVSSRLKMLTLFLQTYSTLTLWLRVFALPKTPRPTTKPCCSSPTLLLCYLTKYSRSLCPSLHSWGILSCDWTMLIVCRLSTRSLRMWSLSY
uniref:Uncharacterized protein n=1 Tax=Cacopsylla melanoneura TaxID=428564 RepID=A0A8D8S1X7_9HEMI